MTMQEKAIEQLERISRHLATIGEKEDYTDVAIQALEQECEDAVSRQEVLDIVKFEENWLFDAKSNNADTNIAFSGIRTQVAKLSPVTPARKKGKWINTDVTILNRQGYLAHEVICSECDGISYFRSMGNKYIGANYCPNCGAKMESEE